jgi:hypothetical protein
MNQEQRISAEQSGPSTSAGAWGLRHPGLVMGKGGRNENFLSVSMSKATGVRLARVHQRLGAATAREIPV